jgi:nucleoside-diphosphate-sugar epimerase
VNVEGSLNLMEIMRVFGIGRMVRISSEETYGPFEAEGLQKSTHNAR